MSAPLLEPVGSGGADVVARGSGGDSDFSRMDVLVTELVNNHGGWLSKRTKPGFNGQQGWKKRWVGIYDGERAREPTGSSIMQSESSSSPKYTMAGMLFYSKTQAKSNQMSDTDAKVTSGRPHHDRHRHRYRQQHCRPTTFHHRAT